MQAISSPLQLLTLHRYNSPLSNFRSSVIVFLSRVGFVSGFGRVCRHRGCSGWWRLAQWGRRNGIYPVRRTRVGQACLFLGHDVEGDGRAGLRRMKRNRAVPHVGRKQHEHACVRLHGAPYGVRDSEWQIGLAEFDPAFP